MSGFITRTLVALVALALAGCSFTLFEGKKIDYKSASAGGKPPPLEVPPDLTAPGTDERYAVPDVGARGSATFSQYSAERTGETRVQGTGTVLPTVDKMRVERAGSQRWLVVQATPEQLWSQVKEFWQENGFLINVERPEAGIMETDWAENRAKIPQDFIRNTVGRALDSLWSTPERDKFRTRLEPGAQPGTTEIYISHRGVMEIYPNEAKDSTVWQPRASDPDLEAEMLRRLMVRLGAEEDRAKVLAAVSGQPERARLTRESDGVASLQMDDAFDRAWRRVGLALDRVGFTVEDRDRSQGLYFVRYVDPEADALTKKSEGILSKLMFWRSDKNDAPPKGAQYRIHVKPAGEGSLVEVLTREGGADRSAPAGKILGMLHEQLK